MDESGKGGEKRGRKNGEKKMNGEERTATSTINDDNQPNDRANIEHSCLKKKGARFAIVHNLSPFFVRFPTSTTVARWFGGPD